MVGLKTWVSVGHRLMIRVGCVASAADGRRQWSGYHAHVLLLRVAAENTRVLAEGMVHADVPFVGVDGRAGAADIVVLAERVTRLIGLREEIGETAGDRIDSTRRG